MMSDDVEQQPSAQASQDIEQRVSFLDVVDQQLSAMRRQAEATIAACESASVTIRLLKAQLDTARKLAEERRQREAKPVRPPTFGHRSRASEVSDTGGQ